MNRREPRRTELPESPSQPSQTGLVPDIENPSYGLSDSELRVLSLVSQGMTDKQIALALNVSVHTINKQVGAVLLKMNVRSRTAAAIHAIREHIVPMVIPLAGLAIEVSRAWTQLA